jgi:protein-S-isoprenylcysteine O-methyltransferase Ste14
MSAMNRDFPTDNPGVQVPAPVFYVAIFFLSLAIQKVCPIDFRIFHSRLGFACRTLLVLLGGTVFVAAFGQFLWTRTAIWPTKPALRLQTKGVYRLSRNPMYCGLLVAYIGIALWFGNWWTLLFFPVLVITIWYYIIKREEAYLQRQFKSEYDQYKKKVRRWI